LIGLFGFGETVDTGEKIQFCVFIRITVSEFVKVMLFSWSEV
jgi:hypothetical protein